MVKIFFLNMVQIVSAMVLLGIATLSGSTILRWFGFTFSNIAENALFSFGIGVALASYLVFAAGSLGWLDSTMIFIVIVILLLISLHALTKINRYAKWHGTESMENVKSWDKLAFILCFILLLHALFNLMGALSPPTEADSLNFHLSANKIFITQGYISFIPYFPWNSPSNAGMWSLLGLLLGSDRLPQIFNYFFGIIGTAALYDLGRRLGNSMIGLIAAAMYYTSTFVTECSSSAKTDLLLTYYVFVSFSAFIEWQRERKPQWLILSGIFTGLACATKYQGLFWLAAFAFGVFLVIITDRELLITRRVYSITLWILFAMLPAMPWWLRNIIASGNPIWPLFSNIIPTKFWTAELSAKYAAWKRGPGNSVFHYLLGLWNLTVHAEKFIPKQNLGVMFNISPLPLAFIPGLLLIWRRLPKFGMKNLTVLGITLLAFYSIWFFTYQQPRYALPLIALLGIPAAVVYVYAKQYRMAHVVATALILCSFALTLSLNILFNIQFLSVVAGRQPVQDFLADKVSFYEDMTWVNSHLPSDRNLLVCFEKTFYIDGRVIRWDRNFWNYNAVPSNFVEQLRNRKVTHIFLPHNQGWFTEFGFDKIWKALVDNGTLRLIYKNPEAKNVTSRTMAKHEYMLLEIYEVVYP
ncbi:MAG: glycosyltransferase family 39 protein [Nitrospirota bacterium]